METEIMRGEGSERKPALFDTYVLPFKRRQEFCLVYRYVQSAYIAIVNIRRFTRIDWGPDEGIRPLRRNIVASHLPQPKFNYCKTLT